MESNFGLVNSDSAISLQSRATLARLRPAGVLAFPAGPQSVLEDLVRDAPGAMALFDKAILFVEDGPPGHPVTGIGFKVP